MKLLIKGIVDVYHFLSRSNIATCRYSPTCSQYLIDSVEKHGVAKGCYKSTLRILSCHPFSKKPFYDPA